MDTPEVTSRRAPQRMCIATRTVCADHQLLRVVAQTTENGDVMIVPDPHRRLPGRGAWITPEVGALEIAEKRKAFSRALKVPGNADLHLVREYLETKPRESTRTLMSAR